MNRNVISFTVPLPPVSLRSNSRAHWAARKRDADAYSIEVGGRWGQAPYQFFAARLGLPWPEAHVVYTWRYAGTAPDHGNLGGNTKYLQDILCMAPKNAKPGYTRWHLGIVEDDKGLTCEYRMERMPHRTDECVLVTIARKETG